jgi:hypothetical protein
MKEGLPNGSAHNGSARDVPWRDVPWRDAMLGATLSTKVPVLGSRPGVLPIFNTTHKKLKANWVQ